MAGKSMEQRAKVGSLLDRWKAAQSKNKALDDRKFAELEKLLTKYDDVVGEHKDGAEDGADLVQKAIDEINVVMTGFVERNKALREKAIKTLGDAESNFSKRFRDLTKARASRVNEYSMLLEQFVDEREKALSELMANDRQAADRVLDRVGEFAETMTGGTQLQEDLAAEADKLAKQIRSLLQNYKRQIADAKDKNAMSALDDLADLL